MVHYALDAPLDTTALMVIRVWIEPASEVTLRAQIRQTSDVSLGFQGSLTVTDVDAVVALVRTWLERTVEARPAHESQHSTPVAGQ